MSIERGFGHLVTGEAGLAVSHGVACHEAMQPSHLSGAALGMAGAAIFDRPMGAGQRAWHQKLRATVEDEGER